MKLYYLYRINELIDSFSLIVSINLLWIMIFIIIFVLLCICSLYSYTCLLSIIIIMMIIGLFDREPIEFILKYMTRVLIVCLINNYY